MNFKKVELNQGGIKGAVIFFTELNDKGIPVLTKVYPRSVVHIALQKKFKELRKHLLDICGQTNADMKEDIAANYADGAMVKTVEFDGDKIFLQGEWERFEGKFIPLETCWIEEQDEYHGWDDLKEIADSIKEETKAYMDGTVKVSDAETIMMWAAHHKDQEITMEMLLDLPQEKLVEMSLKILEKGIGASVSMPGEMEIDTEHMEGVVEELKTQFDVSESESIDLGPIPEKKSKKKNEPVVPSTVDANSNQNAY